MPNHLTFWRFAAAILLGQAKRKAKEKKLDYTFQFSYVELYEPFTREKFVTT